MKRRTLLLHAFPLRRQWAARYVSGSTDSTFEEPPCAIQFRESTESQMTAIMS